ncbi:endonuclease NucS [Alphaproteobacteria bacterium]|nr:endonuclease NucS [Alphaproteobacteria bacterium]
MSKNYYRIMLGQGSKYAEECIENKWFGGGWKFKKDLVTSLPENWRDFNKLQIPVYLENHPGKSKVAAGLACGMLHTICKGIKKDDIVLSPDGNKSYYIGKVVSDYFFVEGEDLPHRRSVEWYSKIFPREEMSEPLKHSTGSIGTVSNISKHHEEIEKFLSGKQFEKIFTTDNSIVDVYNFALEKQLEDFLIENWQNTSLSKNYDIVTDDEGTIIGKQYQTDTGPIDILAISKDQKEFLVVELKKGKASDVVVGQILRYMGYISSEICSDSQVVKGCIIALEDDLRIKNALTMTSNIEFYRYKVSFQLFKNE